MKQMTKMPERGRHDAPSDEDIRWEPDAPRNEVQIELKFNSMM